MAYGQTQKERAWSALNAIPDPAQKADVREYVIYLEGQVRRHRDDASRLRFPDTTGQ
jgi:hypothetical protein